MLLRIVLLAAIAGLVTNQVQAGCPTVISPCTFCSGSSCISCISSEYGADGGTCKKLNCDPNCKTPDCDYAGDGKCDAVCASGYWFQTDHTCLKCHPGCDTDNGGKCTAIYTCTDACKTGFFLHGTAPDQICAPCHDACNGTCSASGECDDFCNDGYVLVNKVCQACHDKCIVTPDACTSANTCTGDCVAGYINDGNTCKPCSSGCNQCTSSNCCDSEGAGFCDNSSYCDTANGYSYQTAANNANKHVCQQ